MAWANYCNFVVMGSILFRERTFLLAQYSFLSSLLILGLGDSHQSWWSAFGVVLSIKHSPSGRLHVSSARLTALQLSKLNHVDVTTIHSPHQFPKYLHSDSFSLTCSFFSLICEHCISFHQISCFIFSQSWICCLLQKNPNFIAGAGSPASRGFGTNRQVTPFL